MTQSQDARIEIRCSQADKVAMRAQARREGYPGRAFASWARARLLGEDVEPPERPRGTLLSAAEAADVAQVSRQQVYMWVDGGELTAYDLPEGMRVRLTNLRALLARRRRRA